MNWPVIALLLITVSFGGGTWFGIDYQQKREAEHEVERKQGWSDALEATAKELAKLKVTNRTVYNAVEREVREHTVYADCQNTDEAMKRLNEAAKGMP